MTALERLKVRIPEAADGSKDNLLNAYLQDAREYILNNTGRIELPPSLVGAQVQLAVIMYNRQGVEGEQAHSSGGVRHSFFSDDDVPKSLRAQILHWRLLRVAQRARDADAIAGEG